MTQSLDFDAISVAEAMADAARLAIQPHYRALSAVENKEDDGRFDPVTEADKAGERAMREILSALRPDDAIFGEEYGRSAGTSGWTWILDPIDGTRAFVAGLPVWTTLIGLVDAAGDAVVGVIDQLNLNERYIGGPDGSQLVTAHGTSQIHVSDCNAVSDAVIATTDPFILTPIEQESWTQLRQTAKIVRYGLDAYAYARLSSGTIDLVAESGLAPYDAAALIPVVRGAGGVATDWHGHPAKPGGQLVCAANQGILDQALTALRPAGDARTLR